MLFGDDGPGELRQTRELGERYAEEETCRGGGARGKGGAEGGCCAVRACSTLGSSGGREAWSWSRMEDKALNKYTGPALTRQHASVTGARVAVQRRCVASEAGPLLAAPTGWAGG